jgi:hypothetical protein
LGKGQLVQPLLIVIGLLTTVVAMLTWRIYLLEREQIRAERRRILEAYKTVPLFTGNDRE